MKNQSAPSKPFKTAKKIILKFVAVIIFNAPLPHPAHSITSASDSLHTEKKYFEALAEADESAFKKDFEMFFVLILSKAQKKAYESHKPFKDRKACIEAYWNAANPNPLFPENDWILEFTRRVQYAKKHFPAPRPPFVDDRGKYYIKYGKPRRRFEDAGGPVSATFFNKPQIQKWFRTQNVTYSLLPNETWSYENVEENFAVHFVREGTIFREVRGLSDMIESGGRANQSIAPGMPREANFRAWLWADMIKRRTGVSPIINHYRGQIDLIEATLPQASISATPQIYLLTNADEVATPQSTLNQRAMEMDLTIEQAKKRAPAAAHDPVQGESKIDFENRVTQFRGPNGKTRLEITFLSKLKKNLLKKGKHKVPDTLALQFSGMLRDENFSPIIRNTTQFSLERKKAARANLPFAVGKLMLLAKPQQAEMTLQIEETNSEKLGFSRQMIEVRDFSGEKLQVSGINFLLHVRNEKLKKLLPTIQIESIDTSPYPWPKIKKSRPPLFYFEIYNLKSSGIENDIEISYKISSISGGDMLEKIQTSKSSVSATYTRPVSGDAMHELIEINLANVTKGRHLLEITVSSSKDASVRASVREIIVVSN